MFTSSQKALSNPTVSWSTSDAAIASVNNGIVTAAKVGTASITATDGAASASISVTVAPGAAAQLVVRTQPIGATIGSALATQPVVEVRDAAGNFTSRWAATVTAAIASGGGTLGGAMSASAVAGVATFQNLSISGTAGARTVSFTAPGLRSRQHIRIAPGLDWQQMRQRGTRLLRR